MASVGLSNLSLHRAFTTFSVLNTQELNLYGYSARRNYSVSASPLLHEQTNISNAQIDLNPHFISGFSDGESSFSINLAKNIKSKWGYSVVCVFSISLHKKDRALLESIKAFFNGVGNIYIDRENSIRYCVSSIKDIAVIIDHFDKYPLITKKRADYELFKQAFYLVSNKKHLSQEGFRQIVAIKASMNTGLSRTAALKEI